MPVVPRYGAERIVALGVVPSSPPFARPEPYEGRAGSSSGPDRYRIAVFDTGAPALATMPSAESPTTWRCQMKCLDRWILPFALVGALVLPLPARGSLFVYQGELFERGAAVSGVFDFRFTRYRTPDALPSDQLGETIELSGVEVRSGGFTITLDFGAEPSVPAATWLAIEVASADRWRGFARLEPLQRLEEANPNVPEDNFPSGAVAFFDLAACPTGWSELVEARGRLVVGLQPGGTLRGTQGNALSNLEVRTHNHFVTNSTQTSSSGAHRHQWASLSSNGTGPEWRSFDTNGAPVSVFQWTNGIDDAGSGIYPLTASPPVALYTSMSTAHEHTINFASVPTTVAAGGLPYLQLLTCRKE